MESVVLEILAKQIEDRAVERVRNLDERGLYRMFLSEICLKIISGTERSPEWF